jgi:hypothetical protein
MMIISWGTVILLRRVESAWNDRSGTAGERILKLLLLQLSLLLRDNLLLIQNFLVQVTRLPRLEFDFENWFFSNSQSLPIYAECSSA